MGRWAPPYYSISKFYQNKKAKALKKIEDLQKVVKECDDKIAELAKQDKVE